MKFKISLSPFVILSSKTFTQIEENKLKEINLNNENNLKTFNEFLNFNTKEDDNKNKGIIGLKITINF